MLVPVVTVIAALAVTSVAIALHVRDRKAAMVRLMEMDERLSTYRDIRCYLGSTVLTAYPSLVKSEVRRRLLHQLRSYDDIEDDASEMRWERIWAPKMYEVVAHLKETDMARQDGEFSDAIDGFETNERLIDDMRSKRAATARRLRWSLGNRERQIVGDSHAAARIAASQARLEAAE